MHPSEAPLLVRVSIAVALAVVVSLAGELAAVAQSCTVTSTGVAFGSYDPFAASDDAATGEVNVACTVGTPFEVQLNAGQHSSGGFSPRKMAHGTVSSWELAYNLYINTARTQIWGDGTGTTYTASGVGQGAGSPIIHVVYAAAPALQNILVGSYGDTVTVTVLY